MGRTRQSREEREATPFDYSHASNDDITESLSESSDMVNVVVSDKDRAVRRHAVVNLQSDLVKKLKFIALDKNMSIGKVLSEFARDRIEAAYNEIFERNAV